MQALTPEQITALAPDEGSVKAAKNLVSTSKWTLLAHNDRALWGLCQGSGKNPYQTAIDMSEPAFKCSCPSRKFPCKHALALLFMHAQHGAQFQNDSQPDWLAEWLDKRAQNAVKKAAKAETAPDPVAQQKRQNARLQKATDGLADLRLWLDDVLRNGLISWKNEAQERCRELAKRMIDAQMPALSGAVAQLADTPFERQDVLLHRLTKLSLLEQSFQNINQLPENWQAEILARLGFPIAKETVLANTPVMDIWQHIGTTHHTLERGESHTHWLCGLGTGQFAYLLDFTIQGAPATLPSVLQGGTYAGELCFYDGVQQKRALSKTWELLDTAPPISGSLNIAQAWEMAHSAFADNPFLTVQPMALAQVNLWRDGEAWALSDGASMLPLELSETQLRHVLAHTAGADFMAFVLRDFEFGETRLLAVQNGSGSLNIVL